MNFASNVDTNQQRQTSPVEDNKPTKMSLFNVGMPLGTSFALLKYKTKLPKAIPIPTKVIRIIMIIIVIFSFLSLFRSYMIYPYKPVPITVQMKKKI